MYGNVTVCDYNDRTGEGSVRGYSVNFNCFHVQVNKKDENGVVTSEIVFKRGVSGSGVDKNWLDEPHIKITNALTALEEAVLEVIEAHKTAKV